MYHADPLKNPLDENYNRLWIQNGKELVSYAVKLVLMRYMLSESHKEKCR